MVGGSQAGSDDEQVWLGPHQPFHALEPALLNFLTFVHCVPGTERVPALPALSAKAKHLSSLLYQLCEVSNCKIPILLVGKLRLRVVKVGSDRASQPRLWPCHHLKLSLWGLSGLEHMSA